MLLDQQVLMYLHSRTLQDTHSFVQKTNCTIAVDPVGIPLNKWADRFSAVWAKKPLSYWTSIGVPTSWCWWVNYEAPTSSFDLLYYEEFSLCHFSFDCRTGFTPDLLTTYQVIQDLESKVKRAQLLEDEKGTVCWTCDLLSWELNFQANVKFMFHELR